MRALVFSLLAGAVVAAAALGAACGGDDNDLPNDFGTAPDSSFVRDTSTSDVSDAGVGIDATDAANGILTMKGNAGGVALPTAVDGVASITTFDAGGGAPDAGDGGAAPFGSTHFLAYFADRPNLCTTGVDHQGETLFAFDIESNDAVLQPGFYSLRDATHTAPPYVRSVSLATLDTQCKPTVDHEPTSGYVGISNVTPDLVAGTYQLTFGSDQISGTFDVQRTCADVHGTVGAGCPQ